jgi:hypothetical protein
VWKERNEGRVPTAQFWLDRRERTGGPAMAAPCGGGEGVGMVCS